MDALSLPWEELDAYAFPPVSLLGKVVTKILHQDCRRVILNFPMMAQNALVLGPGQSVSADSSLPAPGGESVDTAVSQSPHRDLPGLNLHAWFIEPVAYRHKGSLMKWQHE